MRAPPASTPSEPRPPRLHRTQQRRLPVEAHQHPMSIFLLWQRFLASYFLNFLTGWSPVGAPAELMFKPQCVSGKNEMVTQRSGRLVKGDLAIMGKSVKTNGCTGGVLLRVQAGQS